MGQEPIHEFHMKDLFIDVKLEACVNGTTFDYLGKKLFSAEFYRKNIGFGITNIDIEVNTSLQPLVTIIFKDLYGNTIFGTQKEDFGGDESIDYSTIFNWPPPKFLFSFKGYLGRATTWVLNLKRTSTSFNSSDGSYELKCEFVPNQWGFFSDLPFLFLLASKRLRKDALGDKPKAEALRGVKSVFDLIKIGKQVEIKTKDTTSEFDDLVKQLGSIKSNIARAIVVSNILEDGEVIEGIVNNRQITGFKKIELPTLDQIKDESINNSEKIEQKLGSPKELRKLNSYLLLLISIDGKNGFERDEKATNKDNYAAFNADESVNSDAKNKHLELINENLRLIDDEIKRLVFASSESKLESITIGEIFSQTAKDAAFIIGSIIDAGLDGYRGTSGIPSKRQKIRDQLVKEGILIGESFPLMINNEGEEVPATKSNLSEIGKEDVGVDNFEMDFVKRFTEAISEGIAKDLILDGDTLGQDDNKLLQRINNMEITSNNPYKSYYTNIATNILVRGGIVGHMTRSGDPNIPGDYNKFWGGDGNSRQNIEDIAVRDASNVTDTIINNLSDIDLLLMKRFCNFFERFYDADGEELIKFENGEQKSFGDIESNSDTYPVLMSTNPEQKLLFIQLWTELRKPSLLEGVDFDKKSGRIIYDRDEIPNLPENVTINFLKEFNVGISNAQNQLSFVSDDYKATRIFNNGISYTFMEKEGLFRSDSYWGVVFKGAENKKAQEANSAPTDAEYKTKNKDDNSWFKQSSPLGYIPINSKYEEGTNKLTRVEILEEWRDFVFAGTNFPLTLDYNACKNPTPEFYGATASTITSSNNLSGLKQFLWINDIASDGFEKSQLEITSTRPDIDVAGNFGYTVCHHQPKNSSFVFNTLVFDMFGKTDEAISQRIFIRKFCETLNENINKIEDKKNQIIGSVLGKAGESEGALYKQMHVLYHQWQSLSYKDKLDSKGGLCGSVDEHKDGDKFNVAKDLEMRFGTRHYNMIGDNVEIVEDKNNENDDEVGLHDIQQEEENKKIKDGTFIYDFPLQRITGVKNGDKPVKVRDSIINLEPLYKIDGRTTVLNIIQKICTKNNFLFIPIPGNPGYLDVSQIYSPDSSPAYIDVKNFFHVLFTPTPESRTKTRNNNGDSLSLAKNHEEYNTKSFVIKYGSPDNQIIKNVKVGTDDNKVTAESIINLQRLVDNENQNKKVTTDCSMLPVLAGRSYKATVDMLGNAQVYPMQFFFLKNSPLFGGLYQIMKVNHSISPNDFSTSADGIRMRFSSKYGGIKPITLQTFRDLGPLEAPLAVGAGFSKIDTEALKNVKSYPTGAISGLMANLKDYSSVSFVDGDRGGPVAQQVKLMSASALSVYDSSLGVRDVWYAGKIVGSEQMYIFDSYPMPAKLLSAYKLMKNAAISAGINLRVRSAYRDPYNNIVDKNGKHISSSQLSIRKSNVIDKSKKNDINYLKTAHSKKFDVETAIPGRSIHNRGFALDLNCGGIKHNNFKQNIFEWLMLNAYKFGFVRTVPGEEWHWAYNPGKAMFQFDSRKSELWHGLPDILGIPKTKKEIETAQNSET